MMKLSQLSSPLDACLPQAEGRIKVGVDTVWFPLTLALSRQRRGG